MIDVSRTNERVGEIDLLRFLAAIAVMFFHLSFRGHAADELSIVSYPLLEPYAMYGFLGVNLFFMISGFVILMTVSNAADIRSFLVSRVVRLYPAFWSSCTLTFILILLVGAPYFHASLTQYLINMTMLSGYVGVPAIDGVYWSLFVEIRFYALVLLAIAFKQIRNSDHLLAVWLLASVVLEVLPIRTLRHWLITDYSGYFILGATYYLLWARGFSATRVILLIVAIAFTLRRSIDEASQFVQHYRIAADPMIVVIIVFVFNLLFLLIALRKTGLVGRQNWLVVGALTYPLYLLHQNIGYMIFNIGHENVNLHVLFWGVIVGLLGLSYGTHVLVEKRWRLPLRQTLTQFSNAVGKRVSELRA